jgi:hypothetical protein
MAAGRAALASGRMIGQDKDVHFTGVGDPRNMSGRNLRRGERQCQV